MKISLRTKVIAGIFGVFTLIGFNGIEKQEQKLSQRVEASPSMGNDAYSYRVDEPLMYSLLQTKSNNIVVISGSKDLDAEDYGISAEMLEACQAENVETLGDLNVIDAESGTCSLVPEWRAGSLNKEAEAYRERVNSGYYNN